MRRRKSTCTWIRTGEKDPLGNLWRFDDDQRHCGEALVKNTSVACAACNRSRVLRGFHRISWVSRNAVDDDGLRTEHTSSGVRGTQHSQSNRFQKSFGQDQTYRTEVLVASRDDQVRENEDEADLMRANLADHLRKGKTRCESDELIRGVGGMVTVSFSHKENEQNWKKLQERKITFAASIWHEVGRVAVQHRRSRQVSRIRASVAG